MRNKHIHFYIAGLLMVTLMACRIGKDYQRPPVDLPQQFSNTSYADTSSIADIEWSRFFTDPTLQRLISQGIQHNHDLLIAIKRIDIAQAQLNQARLLQLPEITAQVSGQISRPSDNSLNGISVNNFLNKAYLENYQAAINISWEADVWGKIRRQKETVLAEYLQTREAAKAVQTQLVANIAQSFFNLLMLDKQLDIARNNLSLNDTFVNVTRLLRDGGVVTTLAVQQAESQRQATALLIPQLEQSMALQENTLSLLTGQLPGTIILSTTLQAFAANNDLPTGLPVAMVSRRPDVRVSELALVAANAQVGIAQANMYPALNISVGGGFETFTASNWFNIPSSLFGLATGVIAQPVFQKKRLKTQYEIAKIQREQAVIRFRQSVLQAATEVSNVLVQTDKLKEQQQIASSQVDTLRRAVGNAQLLYKSDMANYLEVITAQSNTLQAELNLASIQRSRLSAMVELYRSLGGGWK